MIDFLNEIRQAKTLMENRECCLRRVNRKEFLDRIAWNNSNGYYSRHGVMQDINGSKMIYYIAFPKPEPRKVENDEPQNITGNHGADDPHWMHY